MRPLILWLIAICTLTVAVATCGDDDDDDSSDASNDDDVDDDETDDDNDDDDSIDDDVDDDADDDTQAECDTWTDSTSGLTWMVDPAITSPYDLPLSWQESVDFCEALSCGGHDDWRLPSISELRSLIRGCPHTGYGGSCNVTDENPFSWEDDGDGGGCFGCGDGSGPADGCYWPQEVSGSCERYWSITADGFDEEDHWYVIFRKAGLGWSSGSGSNSNARCVRGEFAPVESK